MARIQFCVSPRVSARDDANMSFVGWRTIYRGEAEELWT